MASGAWRRTRESLRLARLTILGSVMVLGCCNPKTLCFLLEVATTISVQIWNGIPILHRNATKRGLYPMLLM
jgi:hypothetical protein